MKYFKQIKNLKKLDIKSLVSLCSEIRLFLVHAVSKTGGHLASNLGVVELTVALHYCFNSPVDKIVWDVGHQSYVHKILTNRAGKFKTLRQKDGLSGFPKASESIHDAFDTGHSSTSVSVGLGLCAARDLAKQNYSVISVIGDSAMTGGLAFEALNNARKLNTNFIVILNDNQMSISENVLGISKSLNALRTDPYYLEAKADINNILNKIPIVGTTLSKTLEKAKNGLRYLLVPGALFEEFGFKYIGPIDGHNIEELIDVLNRSKNMNAPVLLHIYTTKGKGYLPAEISPNFFHGVPKFDVKTGSPLNKQNHLTYTDVFGQAIVSLGKANEKIVAVTAAMPSGTGLSCFSKQFPKRIFDVGIAESHAVTFSAGLAKSGFIPIVAIYSTFLQRSYDQIVHDVCLQNLHVIFAIDRAGVVGEDGATHQGLFDISFLSHIPNLTFVAPKNSTEFEQMLQFAVSLKSPIAIRYPKGKISNVLLDRHEKIVLGKSELIESGSLIAIISLGSMMNVSLEVLNLLKADGFNPTLINARFIKPIDTEMVCSLLKYKFVFVLEEGIYSGGFASKILEEMSRQNVKCNVFHSFSFPNEFINQGTREQIFLKYGLDSCGIYSTIKGIIENERKTGKNKA